MKHAMSKTALREIKNSFSRWMAILAIVALGVGFFSGLKICEDDFIATGDQYTKTQNFHDARLLTTLGLEDEDVRYVAAIDGVAAAEGAYSTDALFSADTIEGEQVAKFHTLSATMDKPVLIAGKLPERADQVVGDSRYFSESDLGHKLCISAENSEDTRDMFACQEYELVGLINSPAYLNFERGSTSLGNGSVACFFYLLPEGFSSEYYTEIDVDFADDFPLFSAAYDDYAKTMSEKLETALEDCGKRRYDVVIDEAREKLADAKAELADGEAELQKHQQELEDAKAELVQGQADLDKARRELSDGETRLKSGKADLAAGQTQLQQAKAELADGEQQLREAKEQLAASRKTYEENLAAFQQEKEQTYARLDAALAAGAMSQAEYAAAKAQADQQFAAAFAELDSARQKLEAGEAEAAKSEKQLAAARRQIKKNQAKLTQAQQEINANERKLASARQEIADGEAELADGRAQILDGEREIAEGEEELADARDKLRDAEKKVDDIEYPTNYVLGRDANIGYVCFESDAKIVDGIAKVFPVFFFLVAALVCMTTMTRMIDEQRTQIGVLKALGYGRRQILRKYVFYSGSAAVIGAVSGFIIGIHLFPWVIWQAYGIMYGFADLLFCFDWKLGCISLLAALLCSVGVTVYACTAELREVPAQLIRPKAPKAGKRIFLEHVPLIWNRLKFLVKVSIRNTFRYKKRFFMMVLGICGCTALLVTGLGIKDSIANVVAFQYDEIHHMDYTVSFNKEMTPALQDAFREETEEVTADCLFACTGSVDVSTAGMTKSINLVACDESDDTTRFIDLHQKETKIPYPQTGEGVINTNLGEILGVGVGDSLTVYDSDHRKLTVKLVALCDNYVYNYLYINMDTYEDAWGTPEINTAYVIGVADESGTVADPHAGGAALMNARNVSAVTVTEDFRDRIDHMMQSLNAIVALVVASAGALAFIVLYNLTNINITERVREIATIKVLGFYPNETASYVFRENILLTAISALVGLPLGKLLHAFVIAQIKIDMLSFDVRINLLSYVLGVAITFLFALFVNLVMQRKLARVSMTESLKAIE